MKYILIFILLIVLELIYFYIANKLNIIDKPNQRSSHTEITLRGGGIIFYFGMLLYAIFFGWEYKWFLLALTLISGISFLDDVYTISSKKRLLIHFVAMLIMFYQIGFLEFPWWYAFIALIFCTGVINAYNFMDGINGITCGYSLIVLLSLNYINEWVTPFVDPNMIYVSLLSIFVFGFFNFRRKAKCFAGDVGSVSIAFILLFLLGNLILLTNDLSYVLFLAVYGIDTILTIGHRLLLKENIFEAHRKHIYQLMVHELKYSHLKVTSIYMILQLVITIGYLLINDSARWYYFIGVIVVLIITYLIMVRRFFYQKKRV